MLVPVSSRFHGLSGYVLVSTIPNSVPEPAFPEVTPEITGYSRANLSRLSGFVPVQYISTVFYHKL